ncbi:hypothetical protein BDV98DRAFT_576887 [Pterulicium gracile]|uniref:Uncharacterized protein n=1 Tax=Pterulicium gracile TaxID=1884261 RepID=A0A5C3Q1L5_9AGAR|nr:hypothetical protein BDV98DRAFT_576887 [Pterula gracilis]
MMVPPPLNCSKSPYGRVSLPAIPDNPPHQTARSPREERLGAARATTSHGRCCFDGGRGVFLGCVFSLFLSLCLFASNISLRLSELK